MRPAQLEGGYRAGPFGAGPFGLHRADRQLDSLPSLPGNRSVSARGAARSNMRQTSNLYSPFVCCSGVLSLSRGKDFPGREQTRNCCLCPLWSEAVVFFGKKRTEQLKTAALKRNKITRHSCRRPPSVCLRDSALPGPCTFGTQLNEILQSSLRNQFPRILAASSGGMQFIVCANRLPQSL